MLVSEPEREELERIFNSIQESIDHKSFEVLILSPSTMYRLLDVLDDYQSVDDRIPTLIESITKGF